MSKISYWHCMPVNLISGPVLVPEPTFSDTDYLPGYKWLEKRIGYFPLFMAAGNEDSAPYNAGYNNQWRVVLSSRYCKEKNRVISLERRAKGDAPNFAMFRFDERPKVCCFLDSAWWSIGVLTPHLNNEEPQEREVRSVLKPSWSHARWVREIKKDKIGIEMVVPQLDLRDAVEVWVRNKRAKQHLEKLGFKNVQVRRIPVEAPWY